MKKLFVIILDNIGGFVFLISVVVLLLTLFFREYDDTDDKRNRKRSGMSLYIDHGTGCHYLSAGIFGKLTPRLDAHGNHVCRKINP